MVTVVMVTVVMVTIFMVTDVMVTVFMITGSGYGNRCYCYSCCHGYCGYSYVIALVG